MDSESAHGSRRSFEWPAFLASLTIGAVSLFVGIVAIKVFYATQLHLRVAEMQVNGVPINIWRTREIGDLMNQWDDRLQCQRKFQIEARNGYDNAQRDAQAALGIKNAAEQKFIAELNKLRIEFARDVRPGAPTAAPVPPIQDADAGYLAIYAAISAQLAGENAAALKKRRDHLDVSYEDVLRMRAAAQAAQATADTGKTTLENADATRKGTEAEAARLFGMSTSEVQADLLEKVRNLIKELQRSQFLEEQPEASAGTEKRREVDCRDPLRLNAAASAPMTTEAAAQASPEGSKPQGENWIWTALKWTGQRLERAFDWTSQRLERAFDWRIVFWPTDNLVLSLAVVMGVLGSCLYVLAERFGLAGERRERLDPADRYRTDLGQSLLRLFFGGVTALVVYLVAKAAVPIVADTSRIGGQAPLNPYFISFVGIMSGLVSERAIRSLQSAGERVFSAGGKLDMTPRWATPMLIAKYAEKQKQMAAAKPDAIDSLAKYLGLPRGATEDAIAGKRAVMPTEQVVMAAFVGADDREAFSDLPPEGAKPPPPGAGGAQAGGPTYTPS